MQSYPLTGTGPEIVRGAVHGHCQTRRRTPGRETGRLRPAASNMPHSIQQVFDGHFNILYVFLCHVFFCFSFFFDFEAERLRGGLTDAPSGCWVSFQHDIFRDGVGS